MEKAESLRQQRLEVTVKVRYVEVDLEVDLEVEQDSEERVVDLEEVADTEEVD